MTSNEPSRPRITENPLISQVLANGGAAATVLWGYIGPSREGYITLHPSLRNLSISIEIAERDIIHIADIPESIFPFDAKIVWIKKEAPIAHRLMENAEAVVGVNAKSGSVEIAKGRLRMRVAGQARGADCHSPCATCHCPCSVCVSICQVQLPT
jgi:hypothetical protein